MSGLQGGLGLIRLLLLSLDLLPCKWLEFLGDSSHLFPLCCPDVMLGVVPGTLGRLLVGVVE